MTPLSYLIIANAQPVSRRIAPLGVQVAQAVQNNLWGSLISQEVGVYFEARP